MDSLPADIKDPTLVWVLCGRTEHPAVILHNVDDDHVYVQWTSNGTTGIANKANIRQEVSGRRRRSPPPPPAAAVDSRSNSRRQRQAQKPAPVNQQAVAPTNDNDESPQSEKRRLELPWPRDSNKRRKILVKRRVAKRTVLPFTEQQRDRSDQETDDADSASTSSSERGGFTEPLVAQLHNSNKHVSVTVVLPSLTQQSSRESDSGDEDKDDGALNRRLNKTKSEESEFEPEEETDEDEGMIQSGADESSPEVVGRRSRRKAERKGYLDEYVEEEPPSTELEKQDGLKRSSYEAHDKKIPHKRPGVARDEFPTHEHVVSNDDRLPNATGDARLKNHNSTSSSDSDELNNVAATKEVQVTQPKSGDITSTHSIDANNGGASDGGVPVENVPGANARNHGTSGGVSSVEESFQANGAVPDHEASVFDKDTEDEASPPKQEARSSLDESNEEGNVFDKDTDDELSERNKPIAEGRKPERQKQMDHLPSSAQQTETRTLDDQKEPSAGSQPPFGVKHAQKAEGRSLGSPKECTVDEINRLLDEVNREYYMYREFPFIEAVAPLDPNNTLDAAKREWGAEILLDLLKNKMCVKCGQKLGIYFHKYSTERKLMGTSCSTCYFDINRPLNAPFHLSQMAWSADQAEAALGVLDLKDSLLSNHKHAALELQDGTTVFPDESVVECAVELCGSVWDFHRTMAIHLRKSIMSPLAESKQKQSNTTSQVRSTA